MMGLFTVSGPRDSSILQLGTYVSGTAEFLFPTLVARPSKISSRSLMPSMKPL